ncbi:MAG: uracil-DNA glycosylase [Treponema sp.]|jgi:DNA polymerase|nr:uracil-DNA glycosylase [Treponema sp.]
MTAEQKRAVARLLDRCTDYLRDGYALDRTYVFTDAAASPALTEIPGQAGEFSPKPASSAHTADSLEEIAADVRRCAACARRNQGPPPSPGDGRQRPLILILGDCPETHDGETGAPLSGAGGELLDRMLSSIGLSRDKHCYTTTLVKCPGSGSTPPLLEEQNACLPLFFRELAVCKPRLILRLSRPVQTALGAPEPPAEFPLTHPDFPDVPVFTTLHPGAILMDASLKRPAWEDLKRLRARLAELDGEREPFV